MYLCWISVLDEVDDFRGSLGRLLQMRHVPALLHPHQTGIRHFIHKPAQGIESLILQALCQTSRAVPLGQITRLLKLAQTPVQVIPSAASLLHQRNAASVVSIRVLTSPRKAWGPEFYPGGPTKLAFLCRSSALSY